MKGFFRENKHHSFILLYGAGHWVVGRYNATSMFTFPSEVKRVAWPFVRGFHELNKYSAPSLEHSSSDYSIMN